MHGVYDPLMLKSNEFWKAIFRVNILFQRITTTTTKPFVPSIWGRLHEPKENYAGSGTWISFLH